MTTYELIIYLLQKTFIFAIPLLIVALGGMFTERSGIINIALEGIMVVGAFVGVFFIQIMQKAGWQQDNAQWLLLLSLIVAGITGAIYSVALAFASINLKADQVIGGTALNMLAPALVIFIARSIQDSGAQQVQFFNWFRIEQVGGLSKIPFLGDILFKNGYITTYIGLGILVVSALVLYKTKFGLRLRSCGEHPQAADSLGINVYKIRYSGTMISGFLAGIGGLCFVIPTMTFFNADVAGYGFLALAVMIFGNWKPLNILGAAIFFGLFKTLAASYNVVPFLNNLEVDSYIYKMIPYIATMIILAFTSKKSRAPKAEGIPYDKGSR